MQLTIDDSLFQLELPPGVDSRLQELLNRQHNGIELSLSEKQEAEGLVELAEFLSLLRLRALRLTTVPKPR